jgi:hypothetical protein
MLAAAATFGGSEGFATLLCLRVRAGLKAQRTSIQTHRRWESQMGTQALFNYIVSHGLTLGLILAGGYLAWLFNHNEDLREHRTALALSLAMLLAVPIGGWMVSALTHSRTAGITAMVLLALAVGRLVLKLMDRAANDFLGGLLFDAMFCEGPFAELVRRVQKLPSLKLLHHWRDTGHAGKAYRTARRAMVAQREALPLWLFAAETAAVHLKNWPAAIRIGRRLQRCREFSDDEKAYAANHLKGLAAAQGYQLDTCELGGNGRSRAKLKPLAQVAQLRGRGEYSQARGLLELMLRKDPENLAAAALLVRVYAQDLRQRDKAEGVIEDLARQPFTPSALIDFLRNSLAEWEALPPAALPSAPPPAAPAKRTARPGRSNKIVLEAPPIFRSTALPSRPVATMAASATASASLPVVGEKAVAERESPPVFTEGLSPQIASLVEQGRLGTAVEELEKLIRAEPDNLSPVLELVQVQILNCGNLSTGEKIVAKIQCERRFTVPQRADALAKLKTWREKHEKDNPPRIY